MTDKLVGVINREDLKNYLKNDILEVTFTKANGEERVMKCTLKEDILNKYFDSNDNEKTERKINEEILSVFDIDVENWRSFRIDSVKTVKNEKGEDVLELHEV